MAGRWKVEVVLSCCTIAALLIVLPHAVVDAQSSSPPAVPWWSPSRQILFWTSSYYPFINFLMWTVRKDCKARFDDHVCVLPLQNTGPGGIWRKPPLWYFITLVPSAPEPGNYPEHKADLAIRLDNFYIVGFANKWGQWFATTEGAAVIPNAIPLGFSGSYPDLLEFAYNVRKVRLGVSATNWARHVLADFDLRDLRTGNIDTVKKALATQIITICEAARFPAIRQLIVDRWLTGVYLGKDEDTLLHNWKNFSCAILSFQMHHNWWRTVESGTLFEKLKINSDVEGRQSVDLVLQPTTCLDAAIPVYN